MFNSRRESLFRYDGVVVGLYKPNLLVENKVIVELKSIRGIDNIHFAQCINYLKATNLPVCLLLNFGVWRASGSSQTHSESRAARSMGSSNK